MRRTRHRTSLVLAALGGVLVSLSLTGAAQARPAPEPATRAQATWPVDLTAATADQGNVARSGGRLTVRDPHARPARMPAGHSYAHYAAPETALGRTVHALTVTTTATRPVGSEVATDIRGRDASGTWTQWTTTTPGTAVAFASPVSTVQVRIVLSAPSAGPSPTVSAVRLAAADPAQSGLPLATAEASASAAVTYRVFATREGLVGGTTANGHVITGRDHFVALPSRRLLDADGSRTYQVTVCHGSRCETAPVWDVGPWNTTDDYWNPAGTRQSWGDLPQGTPEAQAAYLNGYNGGRDQFGRTVANPAGIDLADGTFWDGLGMTDNDWVYVTFGAAPAPTVKYWVDTFANAPVYASATSTTQTGTLYGGTNYVYCKVWGRMIGTSTSYNHWWLRTDPDSGPAGQYVSAYYLSRWGNDEAKDNNGTVIPTC